MTQDRLIFPLEKVCNLARVKIGTCRRYSFLAIQTYTKSWLGQTYYKVKT